MKKIDAEALYESIKHKRIKLDEKKHSMMLFDVFANPNKGSVSAFCIEAGISDSSFYRWLDKNETFKECYGLAKMYCRENWEEEGRTISEEVNMPGTSNHKFERWRMLGWIKFGIGKNSRIRLNLDPNSTPNEHYGQLLKQAAEGDFTAGEIKQLMEAVNVGLNTHQVFKLQKEIDQLKFDLTIMNENSNEHNPVSDKGITKKD